MQRLWEGYNSIQAGNELVMRFIKGEFVHMSSLLYKLVVGNWQSMIGARICEAIIIWRNVSRSIISSFPPVYNSLRELFHQGMRSVLAFQSPFFFEIIALLHLRIFRIPGFLKRLLVGIAVIYIRNVVTFRTVKGQCRTLKKNYLRCAFHFFTLISGK